MLVLIILNNCVATSASLLGPAITVVKTGNVYQAGLSYTSSNIIKKQFGLTPEEYVKNVLNYDSHKDGLILALNKSNKLKNIELSLSSKNNEHAYDDFLKAVKKVLK